MKAIYSLLFLSFFFVMYVTFTANHTDTPEHIESIAVTFECTSCKKRNKFYISGPEDHTFKAVKFPLKMTLKAGAYKMTYWQNSVRQIHLPFDVRSDSDNIIRVKD